MEGLLSHVNTALTTRQNLLDLTTPEATATHRPIPHARVVKALLETLAFRNLNVVGDEYAVTPDGMRMFGVMALDVIESGVRLAIGLRNSHDKSLSLAFTLGYKVFVCDNLAFYGDFNPVVRKHSSRIDIEEVVGLAVDKMQRNFVPLMRQIEAWKGFELPDSRAKLVIYDAFIGEKLEAPKHLARTVHRLYVEPTQEEFEERTMWSLSNAFTSAFQELDPIPRFRATAKLAPFLRDVS